MRTVLALVSLPALCLPIAAATADDLDPAVLKARDAYAMCVGKAALSEAKTNRTPEAGAEAALAACSAEARAVLDALTGAPTNMSVADAIETLNAMQSKGRTIVIQMIKENRS